LKAKFSSLSSEVGGFFQSFVLVTIKSYAEGVSIFHITAFSNSLGKLKGDELVL